jgi:hypothetical protein
VNERSSGVSAGRYYGFPQAQPRKPTNIHQYDKDDRSPREEICSTSDCILSVSDFVFHFKVKDYSAA